MHRLDAAHGEERQSVVWSERTGKPSTRKSRLSTRLLLAAFAIAVAAFAAGAKTTASWSGGDKPGFVAAKLLAKAKSNPDETVRVIITHKRGAAAAQSAFSTASAGHGKFNRRLGIIGGVAVELPAKAVERLARVPGLIVTVDAPMKPTAIFSSTQLWPHESGNSMLWGPIDANPDPKLPAIAFVDTGIEDGRADFAGRIVAHVKLGTATPDSPGDGRGHGTFVAGVAAGAAAGYAGASPAAKIVMLDVMNDSGMAWTSDVIAAADWILRNKATYNIRVANFSLHTSAPSSFTVDPLDKAVEKLWFSGVTVVAAAGNYGNGTRVDVKYAPANDPFVITVGAVDLNGSVKLGDDLVAPWSVFGYTYDGFAKPEIGTAGRYMVGPVPVGSTLVAERPANVTAPGYMQLSGTSFSAPVVAGAAAHILALHPEYTPDQVKGALMVTARPLANVDQLAIGVGEVNAVRAATFVNPPNPNLALNRFVVPDPAGGSTPVFDTASWNSTVQADASWNSASWNSASWASASWNSASWASASWNSASWNSASWNSASWNSQAVIDASWNSSSEADASGIPGDANATGGYPLTAEEQLAVDSDPELTPLTPLP